MSLPVNLQADLDQDSAAIRDLLDRTGLADSLQGLTDVSRLLSAFGKQVAANIFAAGDEHAMNLRALCWVEFLGGFE